MHAFCHGLSIVTLGFSFFWEVERFVNVVVFELNRIEYKQIFITIFTIHTMQEGKSLLE